MDVLLVAGFDYCLLKDKRSGIGVVRGIALQRRSQQVAIKFKITKMAAGIAAAIGVFSLVLGSVSVQAKLSAGTGTIQGRAPTATGKLFVNGPGGPYETGAKLDGTTRPNDYTIDPDTSELILSDADGDVNLAATLDAPAPALVWKDGARALTAEQLSQTFAAAGLSGKQLTATGQPTVTTTTTTGDPRIGTSSIPQTYMFETTAPTVVRVNGAEFAWDSGFPTTGFIGATYQVLALGKVANSAGYTWTTSQPQWTTIDPTGNVTFTQRPTSAQSSYTITGTKAGAPTIEITSTVESWFVFDPSGTYTPIRQVANWCAADQRGGVPTAAQYGVGEGRFQTLDPMPRAVRRGLFPEWGPVSTYKTGVSDWTYTLATYPSYPHETNGMEYWTTTRGTQGNTSYGGGGTSTTAGCVSKL